MKVSFVEIPVIDHLLPLASGYMEACARKDPQIREAVTFEKLSLVSSNAYEKIRDAVMKTSADVYAFSCYVWNMGTVRKLCAELSALPTPPRIILGGPQVMDQAARYLSPEFPHIVLCNGEGERTFPNYLREQLQVEPDLSKVKGLSFFRGPELVTTEAEPRVKDLEEIPSPFLEGLFDGGRWAQAVIETNRGCPFKCTYCFWGAATGAKVYQFTDERVRAELEWISKKRIMNVFIADANWGMLKRDVEFSKYIAESRKKFGAPLALYTSSAKNSKDRVQEITHILADAGLISTQAIALQTMSMETLKQVKRDNIKSESYVDLQKNLNERGLNSYLEMIWPLPGETLSSFRQGLASLCDLGADSFQVHRLLLMNNVAMNDAREEFELVCVQDSDPSSEAEFVVANKWVSNAEYLEGIRYVNSVTSLYTARGLYALGRYLHESGKLPWVDLFTGFAEFCKGEEERSEYAKYCEDSIRTMGFTHYAHPGSILFMNTHQHRVQFDELLERYLKTFPFWSDPEVRVLFEADLLNRPFIFKNTPIEPKAFPFTMLQNVEATPDGYRASIPPEFRALLAKYLPVAEEGGTGEVEIFHRRSKALFNPNKSVNESLYYASDLSTKMRGVSPEWRIPGETVTAGTAAGVLAQAASVTAAVR